MFTKTLVAAGVTAALYFGAAAPSLAAADVWVHVAPPAARTEVVPAPRHGYQWVPGYWQWQRNRHVWHSGYWVRERPGYVYSAPTWVERNGQWQMRSGNWARRDADRDGVPNAVDRRPHDPTRR